MSIYKILSDDHKKIITLVSELKKTKDNDGSEREHIFKKIYKELTSHMQAEEKALYAFLEEKGIAVNLLKEARQEHEEVKDLLQDLENFSWDEDDWMSGIGRLEQEIQHHVREEEGELFKIMQDHLSDEEEKDIALQIKEQKNLYQATAA